MRFSSLLGATVIALVGCSSAAGSSSDTIGTATTTGAPTTAAAPTTSAPSVDTDAASTSVPPPPTAAAPQPGDRLDLVVEGEAMTPALGNGARIVVTAAGPDTPSPARFDIIVFTRTLGDGTVLQLVKRVVGLPGEALAISGCIVDIDGSPLDEPYLDRAVQATDGCGPDVAPTTIPADAVFVLGDHRGRSSDSRSFGVIPLSDIVGTVTG